MASAATSTSGTGNYNVVTAKLYTDLDLLTCDEDMGVDATELFNSLTGFSQSEDYRSLLVAPINMRAALRGAHRPRDRPRAGRRPAHVILKMNALVDRPMIRRLYWRRRPA